MNIYHVGICFLVKMWKLQFIQILYLQINMFFVGSPGYLNGWIDHYLFPNFPVEMEPWQAQSVSHTILHCVASRNVSLFAELLDVSYFNWKWILPVNQHIHVQGVNEGIILGFLPLNLRNQIYRSLSFVSHSQSALKSLTNYSMTWNLSFVSHGQIALKSVTKLLLWLETRVSDTRLLKHN